MKNNVNKEVLFHCPLKLKAGNATIAPPIGTMLGPSGIDIYEFCKNFNKWSKEKKGDIKIGVIVYKDLSYSILTDKEYYDFRSNEFNYILSVSPLYNQLKNAPFENEQHKRGK